MTMTLEATRPCLVGDSRGGVRLPDKQAAGQLIRQRLADLDASQDWLAEAVGAELGIPGPSQSTVSSWMTGRHAPTSPEVTFAVERVLELRPGQLSQLYGYLPVSARSPGPSVEAAVGASDLSERDKRLLLGVYREMRRDR